MALQSSPNHSSPSSRSLLNEKYIAINAVLNYTTADNAYKCNLKIQIERDRIIWFSATHGWGVELVRGRITPAGIEIINHIEKSYQIYDYSSLQLSWQIPCNYMLIQSILLAEIPNTGINLKIKESQKFIVVQQRQALFNILARIYKNIQKLESLTITDNITFHKGAIYYEYKKINTQNFLFSHAKVHFKMFDLNLEYRKVTLPKQPLLFPFKVPQCYVKL
jgi:hypothetical protein